MPSTRRYDVSQYRKHKRPDGWGSLCPDSIGIVAAQALLDSGVEHDGAVYNVDGHLCYCARRHFVAPDGTSCWHGYPIPWQRLPNAARKQLQRIERLSASTYWKAIRKHRGTEFEP